ncbi:hypothetical protein TraAM80_05656 [Trypanosoma rangeli]|uniref:Uncharacterized protein n=1 Tax=Trypanosoma rangeli TaxID=5698 RepID=A0A3R7KC94_TRYRA|nr:uncharacterized protein TraAM80_05656 [Trypanosoma rangeli]RNF03614.1 hypothetical protein TraAM80_05656 [Trypanosoma rangeli]|eukprot:RNF03614.1 hypothetical protein TraAM80_05656 [Trypanosoma rangeli]
MRWRYRSRRWAPLWWRRAIAHLCFVPLIRSWHRARPPKCVRRRALMTGSAPAQVSASHASRRGERSEGTGKRGPCGREDAVDRVRGDERGRAGISPDTCTANGAVAVAGLCAAANRQGGQRGTHEGDGEAADFGKLSRLEQNEEGEENGPASEATRHSRFLKARTSDMSTQRREGAEELPAVSTSVEMRTRS